MEITLKPFRALHAGEMDLIGEEAARFGAFLGLTAMLHYHPS